MKLHQILSTGSLLSISVLFFLRFDLFAQNIQSIQITDSLRFQAANNNGNETPFAVQIIPPTPQSSVYQKYIDHKVDESTGLPNISIPLYEIKLKGTTVPITLSYHASGIKTHQYDGDVGAGWCINVGGYRVMRTIYDKEDEKYPRFSYENFQTHYANIDAYSPASQRADKDLYLNDLKLNYDTRYDHFSYILPTTSGKFIIQNKDENNKFIALIAGGQQDKILFEEQAESNNIYNISITDELGTQYELGGADIIETTMEMPQLTPVGWPLKKMTTIYDETISFEYKQYVTLLNDSYAAGYVYTEAPFYTNWIYYDPGDAQTGSVSGAQYATPYTPAPYPQVDRQSYSSAMIQKITTPYCTIIFNRRGEPIISAPSDENRYTWPHLLSSIEIYNTSNELVRKIEFEYDLVEKNSTNRHNLLRSLSISGLSKTAADDMYHFEYYERSMASVPNVWGYGGFGSYFHEEFQTYPNLLVEKFVGPTPDVYRTIDRLRLNYDIQLGDRGSITSSEYSLKRIIFPTGGYTNYEYEPHLNGSGDCSAGGLRVKRITSKPSDEVDPTFTEFYYEDLHCDVTPGISDFVDESYNFHFFSSVGYPVMTPYLYQCCRTLLFSTSPILSDIMDVHPWYGKVISVHYDQNLNSNGKTVSCYDNPQMFFVRTMPQRAYITPFEGDASIKLQMPVDGMQWGRSFWVDGNMGYTPLLSSRLYYDQADSLKREEKYTYAQILKGQFYELSLVERIKVDADASIGQYGEYNHITSRFDYLEYPLKVGFQRITSKISSEYTESGKITFTETYSYNARGQLFKKSIGDYAETYYYPADFSTPVYSGMVAANMQAPVIEKISYNSRISNHETERTIINYKYVNGMYLPESIQTRTIIADAYRDEITYDCYDNWGNIVQTTSSNGLMTVYVWSYNGQYPIAKIENSSYSDLTLVIPPTTLDAIASRAEPTSADMALLNGLRENHIFNKSAISTYTYEPLVGILTATDPAGLVTHYEYDAMGRLIRIRDHEGDILQEYEYHYYNAK